MTSGEIIKILREREGWSQTELAKLLGLSRSAVSMWESGERVPSTYAYEQLSDLFNVDIDYLMGRSNKMTVLPERLAYENKSTSKDARYVLDKIKGATDDQLKTIRRLVDAILEEDEVNN